MGIILALLFLLGFTGALYAGGGPVPEPGTLPPGTIPTPAAQLWLPVIQR